MDNTNEIEKHEEELGLKDMEIYDENPYKERVISKLQVNTDKRIDRMIKVSEGDVMIDGDTGEITESRNMMMVTTKLVDQDEFVKVYADELRLHMDLKLSTVSVFFYIVSQVQFQQDYIIFVVSDCKESTGLTHGTIYRSLAELCSKGVIARSKVKVKYFINPLYMFKGDRIVVARQYVRDINPFNENDAKDRRRKSAHFMKAIDQGNAQNNGSVSPSQNSPIEKKEKKPFINEDWVE